MTDEDLVDALKALAHPVRLRIMKALSGTERTYRSECLHGRGDLGSWYKRD